MTGMLIGGALNGAILAALALAAPRYTRRILFFVLVFAGTMYVVFAFASEEPSLWLAVELAGVALYGAIGYLGLKRSPWWLVAGWAGHPLWDVALHSIGPGRAFAPERYTIPCITYDLAVAAALGWRLIASRTSPAAGVEVIASGASS
jgi:hypothetical protein